jgi:methionyl-tRNA formyltransferase
MNVIFMGTPDFAATILEGLVSSKHKVIAAFTQADKPKGRGNKIQMSPVKIAATKANVPVFQPQSLRTEETQTLIENLRADIIVVAAYGKILPAAILKIPPQKCVNVHGSLLPKYRGASPIQTAIIKGETKTGITIMYMQEELDAGDIICQKEIPITEEETAASLYPKLAEVGKAELLRGLDLILTPGFIPQKQDVRNVSFAPIIKKDMANLNFNQPAREALNLIRGLDIWPTARTEIRGIKLKVFKAKIVPDITLGAGELILKKRLMVGCQDATLELLEVQPENGPKMSGAAFVNRF